jgi:replicative superfamily II helicase
MAALPQLGSRTYKEDHVVDFEALIKNGEDAVPTEPRELHRSLPNKSVGYGYLRDVQAQLLSAWDARRSEKDLVLKVNTGAGKTITGLVVLQSLINEGKGPALYVAPDKYLAAQVIREAQRLGLATVTDVDAASYLRSEAIGVINAYELLNGRTKFSDRRLSRTMAPIGSVVIDDAHAAITTTRSQLSLHLDRADEAYLKLLRLFEEDLTQQSADSFLDLQTNRTGAPMRVPFWAWRQKLPAARDILRERSDRDEPLYFSWPAIADTLEHCRLVFSRTEVSITPPLPAIEHVSAFTQARHRIFMTATLADESVLVTDFGANADSVSSPVTPATAEDIGERMILAPQEINPALDPAAIRAAVADLAQQHNVVVLVPSTRWAAKWETLGGQVVLAAGIERAVERLREGHVGLVVLVNKYDGVDLPQDACRVLVVDGLPEAFSGEERLRSAVLSDQSGVDDRQIQRLEQGMGRGVRSNEDHCVVLLLGPRLAQLANDPRSFGRFSPATQAQLTASRTVAKQVEEQPLSAILGVVQQALNRDSGWIRFAKTSLRSVPTRNGEVSAEARAERAAFNRAQVGDTESAAQLLLAAAEATQDRKRSGALLEQAAAYLDRHDPSRAQQILATARERNNWVLRPLAGVTYQQVTAPDAQAAAATQILTGRYSTPSGLVLDFESIVDALQFDPTRTEDFEEALFQLGLILGLGSQRPEHELGRGPDNLWALGNGEYWVIEVKSGATSKGIGKRDLGQLGQSLLWFGTAYDSSAYAKPVMVHHQTAVYRDATPIEGMRLITERTLGELRAAIRGFATGLAATKWTSPDRVGELLFGHGLDRGSLARFLVPQRGTVQQ